MGLRIRTNVVSLVAQRHFGDAGHQVAKTMEKLASGLRINKAADDAAGLAISEVIRADVRSLAQARRNTNDGVSLVQVAEGGLNEIGNIMVRLKELAVQGASDTISDRERRYLNLEFYQLKDEIDRIALSTEFNGTKLLAGGDLPEELQKHHNFPPLEVQVDKTFNMATDGPEVANPLNIIRLDFRKLNARLEGENSLGLGSPRNEEGAQVGTKQDSQLTIATVDAALEKVSSYRAHLGALQNRLESADRNLGVRIESLSAARSRIVDADFAAETADLTQSTILHKAGASVLAQANQQPQIALQLLQS